MAIHIRRREFLVALGGVATRPSAARAQQPGKLRRVGVLMTFAADDPDGQADFAVLAQGLQEFGWTVGRNLRLGYRWGANDLERFRTYAAELIALSPDVVVATAGSVVTAFQQASRTVPVVFVTTIDPVGGGRVESLARPGGNATGFLSYEFSISAKWLEMLKLRRTSREWESFGMPPSRLGRVALPRSRPQLLRSISNSLP
jgi:putative ABC transport system substrate-binding protein